MATKFNDQFIDGLSTSAGVEAVVTAAAERVAAKARATAPVDTGAYRDGIVVKKKRQKRIVAVVTATDEKSMIVESKTGNLARALRSEAKGG